MDNTSNTNATNTQPVAPEIPKPDSSARHISQRTLVLILALAGITLFFLFLALRPQWFSTSVTKIVVTPSPTPTPYAQSVLTLTHVPDVTPAPGTVTYTVDIDSSINKVNAVQVELSFDPKVFTSITITPGTFFPKPVQLIKNIDTRLGRVSYALGIQPTDYGTKGQGTVATLTFHYIPSTAPATTTVSFEPKTLVAAEGVTQSVLKEAQPVIISLGSRQDTSTPSQPGY